MELFQNALIYWFNPSLMRRALLIILLLSTSVFLLIRCMDPSDEKAEPILEAGIDRYALYAGSQACQSCHQDISAKHQLTGHFRTSQPSVDSLVKGSFAPGKNTYDYNPELRIVMEKRDSGLFQVVYFRGEEKKAMRFGVTIGSGAKGQTYAWWSNNHLFQMPISFFTAADQWSNSPGFPPKVQFDRPITSRCLECHTTLAMNEAPQEKQEIFNPGRMIFGIDCEKCHGPAASHVEYHKGTPGSQDGKFILNPASFTRQQNLDLCALCHGGNIQATMPPFSFSAGDRLSDFFKIDSLAREAVNKGNVDVHGNQLGLLKASECFVQSEMTCNSCHNPHENERGSTAVFSQRCMSCHQDGHEVKCKIDKRLVSNLENNCIDCHMPLQPSRSIAMVLPGNETPTASMIRSHYIAIYAEEVKKFLKENSASTNRN